MEVELEEVNAFLRVVEAESFTSAARVLGVSKSSVSRRIAQLEEKLGARLLSRTTRKIALTEVGELYYQRASQALIALADAGSKVHALQDAPRGHLRLTAPGDFEAPLAKLLPAFADRYPEVSVEALFSQNVLDLVGFGIDLALRAGKLQDSSLIARKIVATPQYLYASADYLAARGTPLSVEELADHECVLFRASSAKQRWTLTSETDSCDVDVTGRFSGDGFVFIRELLLAGQGIGQQPLVTVSAETPLVRVLPDWSIDSSSLYVVYPAGRFVSAKVRVFRDFCIEWFNRGSAK